MICEDVQELQSKVSAALAARDISRAEEIFFARDPWVRPEPEPGEEPPAYWRASESPYHEYHPECREVLHQLEDLLELFLREVGERREWFKPDPLKDLTGSEVVEILTLKMLVESRAGRFRNYSP